MTDMTVEIQAKLREKFDVAQIGLKPKITCGACSKAFGKACDKHAKAKCRECGQWITPQHMHIEFVGHANVTDRLLSIDPEWTWEPVAFTPDGLPALTADGGLWIRLTVAGVTRIGYGGADGKTGDDAVKEAVSDAIKVTAMRFGVALDLWRKEEASGKPAEEPVPTRRAPQQRPNGQQRPPETAPATTETTPQQARTALGASCKENGWDTDIVESLWMKTADKPLGEATDAARIEKFRTYLFSLPQSDLMLEHAPAAAPNGVPA